MKRFVLMFAGALAFLLNAGGQRLAVDVLPGVINYSGDLQPSALTLSEARPAIQVGLSVGLTGKLYLRGYYLYGTVHADDKKNGTVRSAGRNLNFTSVIGEASVTMEYDVLKTTEPGNITPYILAGGGFFHFNPFTYDTTGKKVYLRPLSTEGEGLPEYPDRKPYALYQFNLIGGFGLKYRVSEQLSVGFEVSFRKLNTDYLDDVSNGYVDKNILLKERGAEAVELAYRGGELNPLKPYPRAGAPRGNPTAKDYYYTGLLRLTYNLGGDGNGLGLHGKNGVACPKNVL